MDWRTRPVLATIWSLLRVPPHTGPIDLLRFVLMNLVIAAVAVGLILGVNALPTGIVWATLAFLAGLVLTPLLASPLEWIVH